MPLVLDPDLSPTDLHGRLAGLRRKMRRIAASAGVFQVLATLLLAVTLLSQFDRERDVERGLDPGAGRLAVGL